MWSQVSVVIGHPNDSIWIHRSFFPHIFNFFKKIATWTSFGFVLQSFDLDIITGLGIFYFLFPDLV